MVSNVDSSNSKYRCIGRIIARDLSLVASRLYRMAVTRPGVTCRRYIIPLFRGRPPGLYKPYKRNGKERETKNETIILRTQSYELISPTTDQYRSGWPFGGSGAQGNSTSHWLISGGSKTRANAIYTGPRSKEEKKRREKQENIQKWSRLHISTSKRMLQGPSFP